MKKKIFVTGGHATPALALIDELAGDKRLDIIFVGRTYAAEYALVREKNIRFLPLTAGKRSWQTIVKIPVGFIQALLYCLRERPRLIVSFGGYVALPVAFAGWVTGVPVITHEQTLSPGLANRMIARIAKKVCVAFLETAQHFDHNKTVFTGLPMRQELFAASNKGPFTSDKAYPILYITGGSQGARSLNERLRPAMGELTKQFTVVHQTGASTYSSGTRYRVERYIPVKELSWVLRHAYLVIGRSGANTTLELAALGNVAILVPLPWAAENEQLLHAKWLASRGGAEIIEQRDLTVDALIECIARIRSNYARYKRLAQNLSKTIPRDGAKRLAQEIYDLV